MLFTTDCVVFRNHNILSSILLRLLDKIYNIKRFTIYSQIVKNQSSERKLFLSFISLTNLSTSLKICSSPNRSASRNRLWSSFTSLKKRKTNRTNNTTDGRIAFIFNDLINYCILAVKTKSNHHINKKLSYSIRENVVFNSGIKHHTICTQYITLIDLPKPTHPRHLILRGECPVDIRYKSISSAAE